MGLVRNDAGTEGLRIRLAEGDLQQFDLFYANLPKHPAIGMLDLGEGWVVFKAPGDPPLGAVDWKRLGVALLDAIKATDLSSLDPEAIHIDQEGQPRLIPHFSKHPDHAPAARAVGDFLRQHVPPEIDAQLDAAIDALTDPIPEVRRTGRALLLGERAKGVGRTGEVRVTVTAPSQSRGQLDTVNSRAAVVLPARHLRALSPTQRSVAAGLAGLPLATLDGLAAADLPLVLESHRRAWTARRSAELVRKKTGLPVAAATGANPMGLLWSLALGTGAAGSALATLTVAMAGIWFITLFGILITLGFSGLALATLSSWNSQRVLLVAARESEREAHEERTRRMGNPHLAAVWEALSAARGTLAAAGLPSAPASDIRSVLKAAEHEVESLLKGDETARRGLANTRPDDIRARLAQLDDASLDGDRGDRLRRTLAELERLEARRDAIVDEADRLAGVLAAVSDALSTWELDAESDGLNRVLEAAAQVRPVRDYEG